jgi:6-phosphogluconolactonase
MPEIVVGSSGELAEVLAGRFLAGAARVWAEAGRFGVALPGGSVATHFFPRLARLGLDWSRVDFFWCDERAVAPDDPRSNYGTARELWLVPAGVPETSIHRMSADDPDLARAAATYAAELARARGTPPRLDLVLLGVGPDGHVSSLFPGHPLLQESTLFVAPVEDAPKPPLRRLTLTLAGITSAALVVVAALGAEKAAVLRRSVEGQDPALPLARVLRAARRTLLLLDPAAAGELAGIERGLVMP